MHPLNMTQILFVGASLMFQFRKRSRRNPFASLTESRDWVDFDQTSIPCRDVRADMVDINMQLLALTQVREAIALNPRANQTYLEEVSIQSAPRLKDPVQLRRTMATYSRKVDQRKEFVRRTPTAL